MRERNKSLANGDLNLQDPWLGALEEKMAQEALKIATAREEAISLTQDTVDSLNTEFPKADLSITSLFESEEQWDSFEISYLQVLKDNRQKTNS